MRKRDRSIKQFDRSKLIVTIMFKYDVCSMVISGMKKVTTCRIRKHRNTSKVPKKGEEGEQLLSQES